MLIITVVQGKGEWKGARVSARARGLEVREARRTLVVVTRS